MKAITEKTWIPIGMAFTVLGVACGAYGTVKILEFEVSQHEKELLELKADRTQTAIFLASLDKNVALMAQRMAAIEKAMPAIHATRRDVRKLRHDVAQLSQGSIKPFFSGPLSSR
jgi:hypothetical protein